jgi:hypothetical protein
MSKSIVEPVEVQEQNDSFLTASYEANYSKSRKRLDDVKSPVLECFLFFPLEMGILTCNYLASILLFM